MLDRLTSATTSAITDGWTYDANGNQLTQTGSTPNTFSVSSTSNELTGITGTLTRSYSYDAAGHTTGYGTNSFTYNDRGRMAATSASSTDYLYNALGQMIEKSGTGGTTVFMQDESGHLLGEYNGSGSLIEETIWLGDIPVATLQPNGSGGVNVYYVHTDHLNAPRKVAQPTTGTLAWRWDTDPFGTATPNQNPAGLGAFPYNLRFPGQYYQAETGLNYNWHRDYDPLVGRYIESDPFGQLGGVNTFAYVRENPLTRIDPLGFCDDETKRCKQVKQDALEHCSQLLPTIDYGFRFWNCVNDYIEEHGCGPGGKPLPQSESAPAPAPAPRPARGSGNQTAPSSGTTTVGAVLLAILAAIGIFALAP